MKRFKEHRLPWDPKVIHQAQAATLSLMTTYIGYVFDWKGLRKAGNSTAVGQCLMIAFC